MAKKPTQPAQETTYFSSSKVSNSDKQDTVIQLTTAMREGLQKASGNSVNVTYAIAAEVLGDVDPALSYEMNKFLASLQTDPVIVQKYRELAEINEEPTTPINLINQRINEIMKILKRSALRYNREAFPVLRRELKGLENAKLWLNRRERLDEYYQIRENTALNRDFFTAVRPANIYKPKGSTIDNFKEYALPNGNLMQIRLLHNLSPEAVTGIDMVYEIIDSKTNRMRFIHLQYKIWNEKSFTINTEREIKQETRIHNTFCKRDFCQLNSKNTTGNTPFRFPACSAYYRPTTNKQRKDASIVTTGIHLPACEVRRLTKVKSSISKADLYENAISNSSFDELFRNGFIGSDWLDIETVQRFYQENKILESNDKIVLSMREVEGISERNLRTLDKVFGK
jgi:hypothetical protein